MKVKFYQKQSGKNPVAEFLNDLPSDEIARIAGCLKNIEELGFDSPRVQFGPWGVTEQPTGLSH